MSSNSNGVRTTSCVGCVSISSKECGTIKCIRYNGSNIYISVPDDRCKMKNSVVK